jgi:hypothetical protein
MRVSFFALQRSKTCHHGELQLHAILLAVRAAAFRYLSEKQRSPEPHRSQTDRMLQLFNGREKFSPSLQHQRFPKVVSSRIMEATRRV